MKIEALVVWPDGKGSHLGFVAARLDYLAGLAVCSPDNVFNPTIGLGVALAKLGKRITKREQRVYDDFLMRQIPILLRQEMGKPTDVGLGNYAYRVTELDIDNPQFDAAVVSCTSLHAILKAKGHSPLSDVSLALGKHLAVILSSGRTRARAKRLSLLQFDLDFSFRVDPAITIRV